MARRTKLSRAKVQTEAEKLLLESRTPKAQKFDWTPELASLMEELLVLARQDVPDQTRVAELSQRIHAFILRPHMKGVGYIRHWIDSLVDDDDT